jgi:hypothetical protein
MARSKTREQNPACLGCELHCSIKDDLNAIWRDSFLPGEGDPELERLVKILFSTVAQLIKSGHITSPQQLGVAFAALFDLCISLEYATLVADTKWVYCPPTGNDPNGILFYPYVKACPRCAVYGSKNKINCSHKPSSDKIGSIAAKTLNIFLTVFASRTSRKWQVRQTRRQSYEVDLLLFNKDTLVLCEVKASPLVAFPLAVKLNKPLTIDRGDGERENLTEHYEPANVDTHSEILLYVPNTPIGFFRLGKWVDYHPLKTFRQRYANDPNAVLSIIKSWQMFYEGYVSGWRKSSEPLKWLTFGCGGDVDDSKNLPGIDRTDDIKKGIYQVIKLGQRFAKQCAKRSVKVALVSNLYAIRHHEEYLQGLQEIVWTYEPELQPCEDNDGANEWRKVRLRDLIKLYDAVITLTESHFRDAELRLSFSLDTLFTDIGGKPCVTNP